MSASKVCIEGLELQLTEVEMLQSMYPGPGEFVWDDPEAPECVRAVLEGDLDLDALETRLGFTVTLTCEDNVEKDKKLVVEVVCLLPHEYPQVGAQVFTRASRLSRDRHKALREELQTEVSGVPEGELVLGTVLQWLQERLYEELPYLGVEQEGKTGPVGKSINDPGRDTITRLWIYSHHIYSKIKRRDIKDWGSELGLHGFCMPGKPGIMLAEGFTCDVDEFWYRIRRMCWKKICIKEQEVVPSPASGDLKDVCRFDPFSELVLDARGGKGREYHMDLGLFNTYLQEHNSSYIFSLFFGVEGRHGNDDDN